MKLFDEVAATASGLGASLTGGWDGVAEARVDLFATVAGITTAAVVVAVIVLGFPALYSAYRYRRNRGQEGKR